MIVCMKKAQYIGTWNLSIKDLRNNKMLPVVVPSTQIKITSKVSIITSACVAAHPPRVHKREVFQALYFSKLSIMCTYLQGAVCRGRPCGTDMDRKSRHGGSSGSQPCRSSTVPGA